MTKNVVIDLDDTGVATYPVLCRMHKEIDPTFELARDEFLTHEKAPHLASILTEGTYLKHTPFRSNFIETVKGLKELGYKIYICTHRGFHPKGKEYTDELLAPYLYLFEDVFYLDTVKNPDKTQFLKETLGSYALIDDNPGFHGKYDGNNVVIFSMPWNKEFPCVTRISFWDLIVTENAIKEVFARNKTVNDN